MYLSWCLLCSKVSKGCSPGYSSCSGGVWESIAEHLVINLLNLSRLDRQTASGLIAVVKTSCKKLATWKFLPSTAILIWGKMFQGLIFTLPWVYSFSEFFRTFCFQDYSYVFFQGGWGSFKGQVKTKIWLLSPSAEILKIGIFCSVSPGKIHDSRWILIPGVMFTFF